MVMNWLLVLFWSLVGQARGSEGLGELHLLVMSVQRGQDADKAIAASAGSWDVDLASQLP